MLPKTTFSDEDIHRLQPAMKVGILGTVDSDGFPHLTLISTLMASSPSQVVWGQFMEGLCKQYVRLNPKTGFLIMTLDKHLWRGKADFSETVKSGTDYDFYNRTPLFRYNAYFGVHTVYNMHLVSQSGEQILPMNRIIFAAIQTMLVRILGKQKAARQVLNPWTRALFAKLDNLKFLSYVAADGYPVIIPVIQAQPLNSQELVFSLTAFGNELQDVPPGSTVAIFGMAFTMEDVLIRGRFQGFRRIGGIHCGVVNVDWVYNPMPPTPMQIYPELAFQAVRDF